MISPNEVLTNTANHFRNTQKRAIEVLAFDEAGRPCEPTIPEAFSFCATGRIRWEARNAPHTIADLAQELADRSIANGETINHYETIDDYSDDREITNAQLAEALDAAASTWDGVDDHCPECGDNTECHHPSTHTFYTEAHYQQP